MTLLDLKVELTKNFQNFQITEDFRTSSVVVRVGEKYVNTLQLAKLDEMRPVGFFIYFQTASWLDRLKIRLGLYQNTVTIIPDRTHLS